MKIITVNLPESYLRLIENEIGENGIFPSRSELIRVAVREFLIKELASVDSFIQFQPDIFRINPTPSPDLVGDSLGAE